MKPSLSALENRLLAILTPLSPVLKDPAAYSLLASGKRLRPLLILTATEALGADPDIALDPACAVEILHTYSLIHDDLPCMDDDDMRRGKPSLHVAYPEWTALLTGDLLLTLPFSVLSEAPGLSPEQKIDLITILAKAAGGSGMILGQALDLLAESQSISWDQLVEIHNHKTGALLGACLEFAAVLSGRKELRTPLRLAGEKIGLAFQVVDDILDVTADEETLGKPVLSDVTNEKSTSVSLLGIEKARALAEELLSSVITSLSDVGIRSDSLFSLLRGLVIRSY